MDSQMRGRLSVHMVLSATIALLAERPLAGTIGFVVLLVMPALVDAFFDNELAYIVITLVFSAIAQFVVLDHLLRATCLVDRETGSRRGAFVWTMVATGLATMLGLLLIIPGLFLAARWAVALPIIVGRRIGSAQAMAMSAEMTRNDMLILTLVFGILMSPLILVIVLSGIGHPVSEIGSAYELVAEVMLSAQPVVAWYASVAIYRLYRTGQPACQEAFA
ncbi:hypothetical protein TPR58_12785 [Sphingomonas sp. HF-S3]|uniref:Glycerophosphoryl diester phosphodiesterase membrane domain-containing protein n=2 Tax=Sphingomonas rustica TaxID=3103142 RepID=A0ABV0B900_9SPHN